jgi:hypothetical protein
MLRLLLSFPASNRHSKGEILARNHSITQASVWVWGALQAEKAAFRLEAYCLRRYRLRQRALELGENGKMAWQALREMNLWFK